VATRGGQVLSCPAGSCQILQRLFSPGGVRNPNLGIGILAAERQRNRVQAGLLDMHGKAAAVMHQGGQHRLHMPLRDFGAPQAVEQARDPAGKGVLHALGVEL